MFKLLDELKDLIASKITSKQLVVADGVNFAYSCTSLCANDCAGGCEGSCGSDCKQNSAPASR